MNPQTLSRDRRDAARTQAALPVKLQCVGTGKYASGHTRNLSSGGALVEVDRPSLLAVGQHVRLGIAWTPKQTVIKSTDMKAGTVIRSLGMGRTNHVAIRFHVSAQLAATA